MTSMKKKNHLGFELLLWKIIPHQKEASTPTGHQIHCNKDEKREGNGIRNSKTNPWAIEFGT